MKNGGILKRRMRVWELLVMGYSQQKIADKVGISLRNVQRDIQWARKENEEWLEDLANKNFASIFREALEGLRQDMARLQEMLEDEEVQQDKPLQVKIIKTISEIRVRYAKCIGEFPVVWSIDGLLKKCSPQPIPRPTIPSLHGITGTKPN